MRLTAIRLACSHCYHLKAFINEIEFEILQPMEHTSLKRSDVMIITNLTRSPMNNPDTMIGEFCMAAGMFLIDWCDRYLYDMNISVFCKERII